MKWFYAVNAAQKGPVEQAEFESLVQTGVITATTLVWREGLADWQPYATVIAAAGGTGAPQPEVRCAECGRQFPLDQTIHLHVGYVCGNCKGAALQKLREGIGSDSEAERIRREHLSHESSVRSVGTLYFMGGIFATVGMIATLFLMGSRSGAAAYVVIVMGVLAILMGYGLNHLKPWARVPTGIVSALGMLMGLLGTISGGSFLVLLFAGLIHGYILYLVLGTRGNMVFSTVYQRVLRETPHIKQKSSLIVWVMLGFLIFFVGMILIAGVARVLR